MKYKIIKSVSQYNQYCKQLEALLGAKPVTAAIRDEIEMLTLLIHTWDDQHPVRENMDPVALLKSFMEDHHMKARDLAELLQVSKSYVSEILHYKKAMSKEVIRTLSTTFKVKQEAFNRPYPLMGKASAGASASA